MPSFRIGLAMALAAFIHVLPARAEPVSVAHHGGWDVSCPKTDGKFSPGECRMVLELSEVDLRSFLVTRRQGGQVFARLTFKPDLYLPRGVDIAFDGDRKARLPFLKCLPDNAGCFVEFDATPLLDRLKAGGVMAIAFSREANSDTTARVNIDGFTEAFAALDDHTSLQPSADNGSTSSAAYDAWHLLCSVAPGEAGGRRCSLTQSATNKTTGHMVSMIMLRRPGAAPLMVVSASGDILIRPGLTMAIDGTPQGIVQFDLCTQLGCSSRAQVADVVLDRLKKGKNAIFTYKVDPDRTIDVSVSLDGFEAAYQALNNGG